MSVQSRDMRNGQVRRAEPAMPKVPYNKGVSLVLWALACITTYQLIRAVRPDISGWVLVAVAIGAQIVFTWLERPTLVGKPNRVSFLVLAFDTLINAGGIYPMALRMPDTPPAQMLISAFGLAPTMSPLGGALLALVFGFLLAASPEAVWHWKD